MIDIFKKSGPNALATGGGILALVGMGITAIQSYEEADPTICVVAVCAMVVVAALIMYLRSLAHTHDEEGKALK